MGERRRAGWAVVACLGSFAGVWVAQRAMRVSLVDVMVYRAAGWTVRDGGDLYALRVMTAQLPMTYPPFAGLLFVPLTWVGVGVMRAAVTAGNLALVVALGALSLRLVGRPARLPAVLLVAGVAVWSEPVWGTLRYGQVNLLLTVLVLWDLTRRADHRWAGVGIGIATGMKLTPGLFVLFLAAAGLIGRGTPYLRRALVATGTFAGTVAVAAVALPHDSRRYWTKVVFTADRPGFGGNVANQSLRGVVARLEHTGDPGSAWVWAAVAVGAVGVAVAVGAVVAGDRLPYGAAWAAVACGVTALLVSPVSWSHHWVWAVPMVVLLGSEAVRRRDRWWTAGAAAAAAVFFSYAIWFMPHGPARPELRQNAPEMLVSAAYPLAGLVFLAVVGTLAGRALYTMPSRRVSTADSGLSAPAALDQPE